MKEVKFKEWNCYVFFTEYVNSKNVAIRLMEIETGEAIGTCTVNLPEVVESYKPLDVVVIKEYGENEGILKVLVDAKIVKRVGLDIVEMNEFGSLAYPCTIL